MKKLICLIISATVIEFSANSWALAPESSLQIFQKSLSLSSFPDQWDSRNIYYLSREEWSRLEKRINKQGRVEQSIYVSDTGEPLTLSSFQDPKTQLQWYVLMSSKKSVQSTGFCFSSHSVREMGMWPRIVRAGQQVIRLLPRGPLSRGLMTGNFRPREPRWPLFLILAPVAVVGAGAGAWWKYQLWEEERPGRNELRATTDMQIGEDPAVIIELINAISEPSGQIWHRKKTTYFEILYKILHNKIDCLESFLLKEPEAYIKFLHCVIFGLMTHEVLPREFQLSSADKHRILEKFLNDLKFKEGYDNADSSFLYGIDYLKRYSKEHLISVIAHELMHNIIYTLLKEENFQRSVVESSLTLDRDFLKSVPEGETYPDYHFMHEFLAEATSIAVRERLSEYIHCELPTNFGLVRPQSPFALVELNPFEPQYFGGIQEPHVRALGSFNFLRKLPAFTNCQDLLRDLLPLIPRVASSEFNFYRPLQEYIKQSHARYFKALLEKQVIPVATQKSIMAIQDALAIDSQLWEVNRHKYLKIWVDLNLRLKTQSCNLSELKLWHAVSLLIMQNDILPSDSLLLSRLSVPQMYNLLDHFLRLVSISPRDSSLNAYEMCYSQESLDTQQLEETMFDIAHESMHLMFTERDCSSKKKWVIRTNVAEELACHLAGLSLTQELSSDHKLDLPEKLKGVYNPKDEDPHAIAKQVLQRMLVMAQDHPELQRNATQLWRQMLHVLLKKAPLTTNPDELVAMFQKELTEK